ncbi:MAG: anthranilate phosphoribosyltransferase [Acidobacteriaceae bacterium]|nr:anthranilate phosphoribosyltransferase [Acidobacteriaceae bacterium]MBV8571320.1 anthranilate phosphoribosyltransferase [Acidobacteriaceae bacterium]
MSHLPYRNFVHLSQQEAHDLMRRMLAGEMSTEGIADVLGFLRRKGETVAELVGFASAIREMAQTVDIDQSTAPVLDTCGTGGDGTNCFNISTATAFVAAAAGLRVAKHGNRRISSQCGSADVLEALGIPITLSASQVADCIRETGIGFLYAPLLHPAVKQAQEARLLLKGRTVFNLLGPLTNPVRARIQLMGAFSVRAAEMLAQAAARLGIERAFVVHGADGLDEVSTTGLTTVFHVEDGRVQKGRWVPADFGLPQASIEDLQGGDPETNARIVRAVLEGEHGAHRDIVIANAAAAIFLAQRAIDLKSAVAVAIEAIDSGAARGKLEKLLEFAACLQTQHLQS